MASKRAVTRRRAKEEFYKKNSETEINVLRMYVNLSEIFQEKLVALHGRVLRLEKEHLVFFSARPAPAPDDLLNVLEKVTKLLSAPFQRCKFPYKTTLGTHKGRGATRQPPSEDPRKNQKREKNREYSQKSRAKTKTLIYKNDERIQHLEKSWKNTKTKNKELLERIDCVLKKILNRRILTLEQQQEAECIRKALELIRGAFEKITYEFDRSIWKTGAESLQDQPSTSRSHEPLGMYHGGRPAEDTRHSPIENSIQLDHMHNQDIMQRNVDSYHESEAALRACQPGSSSSLDVPVPPAEVAAVDQFEEMIRSLETTPTLPVLNIDDISEYVP